MIEPARLSARETTESTDSAPSRPVVRDQAGKFVKGSGQPPKRKPGGVAGNLNAVRNPWATFWKRRALRPEDRWVLRLVQDYVPALVADKGGDVSVAERHVAELAGVARACWALAMADRNLEQVARFVTVERTCLSDLGLKRRARPAQTISDYVASEARKAGPE